MTPKTPRDISLKDRLRIEEGHMPASLSVFRSSSNWANRTPVNRAVADYHGSVEALDYISP